MGDGEAGAVDVVNGCGAICAGTSKNAVAPACTEVSATAVWSSVARKPLKVFAPAVAVGCKTLVTCTCMRRTAMSRSSGKCTGVIPESNELLAALKWWRRLISTSSISRVLCACKSEPTKSTTKPGSAGVARYTRLPLGVVRTAAR